MTTNHFMVADATGTQPAVDLGPTFKLATGSWSPDGKLLALLRGGTGKVDDYIELTTPAGEQQKVISIGAQTAVPRFAPDSGRLTFVSGDAYSGSVSLYVTDVTPEGAPTLLAKADAKLSPDQSGLTNDGSLTISELGWSADGRYIAFRAAYPTSGDPCGTPAT